MRRVLVTGARGFVGRHVLPLLAASGWEVHAVSRSQAVAPGPGAAWHPADLLDPRAGEFLMGSIRPSHWLHLAWYTEPGLYWRSPENLRWVEASLALLRAFAEAGGRRVVAAGTCAEYDWRHGDCREDVTPLAPCTLYGTAKHALRALVESFAGASGMGWAWARLFLLYGPGERPERLVPSVIRSLLSGQEALCTSGDQVRDYLHVEDAASAFAALLEGAGKGVYNVASGVPVAVKEVVTSVAALLGRGELVRLGALPLPAGEPPFLVADTARLRALGWRPRHSLETGLADAIDWWRGQSDMAPVGP